MPPTGPSCSEVAAWLATDFIESFRNDVHPDHWEPNAGFFAITMLSLAYCNAAAALVNDVEQASGKQTVEFIRTTVANAAPGSSRRSADRAEGLHSLFRHGLVHRREPGHLQVMVPGSSSGGAPRKCVLSWILERPGIRASHLQLYGPGTTLGSPSEIIAADHFMLRVGVDLLYEDALAAFRCIHTQCQSDQSFAAKLFSGALKAVNPREPMAEWERKNIAAMLLEPDSSSPKFP